MSHPAQFIAFGLLGEYIGRIYEQVKNRPLYVIRRAAEALNSVQKAVNGSRVLVLGVAYKPDVSDTRESPALDILALLQQRGASVESNSGTFGWKVRTQIGRWLWM